MQTEKDYLKEGQSLYKHRTLSTLHRCNRSHKSIQPCNVAALMIKDGFITNFQIPGLSRLKST